MRHLLLSTIFLIGWNHLVWGGDYLVKLKASPSTMSSFNTLNAASEVKIKDLNFQNWVKISTLHSGDEVLDALQTHPNVEYAQKNYTYRILHNPYIAQKRADIYKMLREDFSWLEGNNDDCPHGTVLCGILSGDEAGGGEGRLLGNGDNCPYDPIICAILGIVDDPGGGGGSVAKDNPDIPPVSSKGIGPDPLYEKQWGMKDLGVDAAHEVSTGRPDIIVAVIDTGVDYTHEDLVQSLWRNPGETGQDAEGNDKATNGVDDDGNGYIDDVIGWDFVDNDNKPYDLKGENLFAGGNPGHGTHCAGSLAAHANNNTGIKGVAPNVKIMVLRFISSQGQGSTESAVAALRYAIDNGAIITSNSWGMVATRQEAEGDQLLMDAIKYSEEKGSIFIAAAGNGDRMGRGFDNDTSNRPMFPSSYDHDIIISVAAINSSDAKGSFSNWGSKSVDIGAPGVQIFSTTVGDGYQDQIEIPGFGTAPWAGTSMAAPFVAGAAALYWSVHTDKTWKEVKEAILSNAIPITSLKNKVLSNGKLNVKELINPSSN